MNIHRIQSEIRLDLEISKIFELIGSFTGIKGVEQNSDTPPSGIFLRISHRMFQLGKDLLNWVHIRRVGLQEQKLGVDAADGPTHSEELVAAQIIHEGHIALLARRQQALLDVTGKFLPLDRLIAVTVRPLRFQTYFQYQGSNPVILLLMHNLVSKAAVRLQSADQGHQKVLLTSTLP